MRICTPRSGNCLELGRKCGRWERAPAKKLSLIHDSARARVRLRDGWVVGFSAAGGLASDISL
jgi:hypothetical protein